MVILNNHKGSHELNSFEGWWKKHMTVKGLNAKTEATDFPTNLREYAMLVVLILHPPYYIGEAWVSDTLLAPSLPCTMLAIVLPSSLEEARSLLPTHLACLSRAKSSLGPFGVVSGPIVAVLWIFI